MEMNETNYKVSPRKWNEIKHRICSKWSKLETSEVEHIKANISVLSKNLQTTYGYSKSFALEEVRRFIAQLPESWLIKLPEELSTKHDPFKWLWPNRAGS